MIGKPSYERTKTGSLESVVTDENIFVKIADDRRRTRTMDKRTPSVEKGTIDTTSQRSLKGQLAYSLRIRDMQYDIFLRLQNTYATKVDF